MSEITRQESGLIDMLVGEVSPQARATASEIMLWFVDKPVSEAIDPVTATKKLGLYIHQLQPTREELVRSLKELGEECRFQPTPDEFRAKVLRYRDQAAFLARQKQLSSMVTVIDPQGAQHAIPASQVEEYLAHGCVLEAGG